MSKPSARKVSEPKLWKWKKFEDYSGATFSPKYAIDEDVASFLSSLTDEQANTAKIIYSGGGFSARVCVVFYQEVNP